MDRMLARFHTTDELAGKIGERDGKATLLFITNDNAVGDRIGIHFYFIVHDRINSSRNVHP